MGVRDVIGRDESWEKINRGSVGEDSGIKVLILTSKVNKLVTTI